MTEPSRILIGDTIAMMATLPERSVHCCVTSPPYWGLRDYGVAGQIGREESPEHYVGKMVDVFRAVWRVLRDDATCWLNLGGGYCKKQLDMIPWRVALALQADGWYLRSIIAWTKKSPMPESVTDRPTSSWEPIFLLAKNDRYFYDAEAVKETLERGDAGSRFDSDRKLAVHPNTGMNRMAPTEPPGGRNQRNVWHLGQEPYAEAHFATFPTEIPRRAIKAGTSEKGCCPQCGAPWTRVVSREQIKRDRPNDYTKRDGADGTGNSCANSVAGVATRTLGWEPTCTCGRADVVPCVVLDPFLGSGTTVAVARELGRHGVGCELNPEYAALSRDRIGQAERPLTHVRVAGDDRADAPLFAGDVR